MSANFSPCRKFRYALEREWGDAGDYVMFVGLNPSTADETADDPTLRRCVAYAKAWGFGAVCMTNLFAFRNKAERHACGGRSDRPGQRPVAAIEG